tara:strand:+ start:33984 stop:34286 length:303 start_codon:yes stop_codon:yes gene_type:complete
MKYENLLSTPEGRAELAETRSLITKLSKDITAALQPYVESGEVPGYRILESTYRRTPSADAVLKYFQDNVDKETTTEDLISKGLIIETKTKQIRKEKKVK